MKCGPCFFQKTRGHFPTGKPGLLLHAKRAPASNLKDFQKLSPYYLRLCAKLLWEPKGYYRPIETDFFTVSSSVGFI